jgi:cytochrome b561
LPADTRYDRLTIVLHWLVVLFVIFLYSSALIWDELPHGVPARKLLQALHISLGLQFVVVLAARVYWGLRHGRRLPGVRSAAQRLLAGGVQNGLHVLLIAQAAIGVCWRIAQQEPLAFFWLFEFPEPHIFRQSDPATARRDARIPRPHDHRRRCAARARRDLSPARAQGWRAAPHVGHAQGLSEDLA